jgi:hypothetical protein
MWGHEGQAVETALSQPRRGLGEEGPGLTGPDLDEWNCPYFG